MEKETIATKMSSLTLGTGKVKRYDDIDKLELHLNTMDYSSLITQRLRPSDSFSMVREEPVYSAKNTKYTKLPKTFVTKSGSLFLYSDSKIMKDNAKHIPSGTKSETWCVQGAGMTSFSHYTLPVWKKYVSPPNCSTISAKRTLGNADKSKNLLRFDRLATLNISQKPHAMNYAIASPTVDDAKQEVSIDTVKDLSEALLSYRLKQITDRERYENTVINSWGGSLAKTDKNKGSSKQKLSGWTLEWLRYPRRPKDCTELDEKTSKSRYYLLQRAKTDLSLSSRCKVPTNTPFSFDDRKGLGTREQPRISRNGKGKKRNQSPFMMSSDKQKHVLDTNICNVSDYPSDNCTFTSDI